MSSTGARGKARRRAPPRTVTAEVMIEALGDQGDGLARHDGQRLAVAGALPGERHRVRYGAADGVTVAASSVARLEAPAPTMGPRAEPVCRHFPACGGCVAQHLPEAAYASWKRDRVAGALGRRSLDVAVALAHTSPLASRRRLRLAVIATTRGIILGFRERRSRRVIDVDECPIAVPALVTLLRALRPLTSALEAVPGEIELTAYPEGVEVVGRGAASPGLADRERLAVWAEGHDVARIAWRADAGPAETIIERRAPRLAWPALNVAPPPGAFLQATAAAEAFVQGVVERALTGMTSVVDLYAGVGTLTAAARVAGCSVVAVEGDPAATAAVRNAGIEAQCRDLDRHPLAASELARFDAVILDPPRRGAAAQAAVLATSNVARIVYASCDPVSFARDAAVLKAAGFRPGPVEVVDQFRFAAEVELVARFDRQEVP